MPALIAGPATPRSDAVAGPAPTPERRRVFGYLAVTDDRDDERERRRVAQYSQVESLELCSLFVDTLGESPYGFAVMRELLRRRADVRAVVLPDLGHVRHIPAVVHLSKAGLARYLGAAVLLCTST